MVTKYHFFGKIFFDHCSAVRFFKDCYLISFICFNEFSYDFGVFEKTQHFKVHIFSDGHKVFAKSAPYFWQAQHRTKVRWRFLKILWPSQNIWPYSNILKLVGNWKDHFKKVLHIANLEILRYLIKQLHSKGFYLIFIILTTLSVVQSSRISI